MEEVMVESYDGKTVRIPIDKKEEYIRNQELIKRYLKEGLTKEEIIKKLEQNK